MLKSLVCPVCKTRLIERGKDLYCDSCGLKGITYNGVYDFIGDQGSYWGELSLEEMEQVLENAKARGWKDAIRNVGSTYRDMNEYILSNSRIDWLFHCVDFSKNSSCLDLGSGWGAITFGLARHYDEVWSLEAVKQRIEFQRIRREQEGINNIKYVRADWLHLPFPNSYFNLVVANGVLEWVGLSDYSRNPKEVQMDFLREVKRVLKPGGCLYIGTENRFAPSFLLGARDHSGLPFTSILPRKLANLLVKLSGKAGEYRQWKQMKRWRDYRTYTYSLWGYRKILIKAGFGPNEIYWTLSYNSPKYAGRFDGESFSFFLKSLKGSITNITTLGSFLVSIGSYLPKRMINLALPLFCPSFLIFAYKGDKNTNFESKLLLCEEPISNFMRISGSRCINGKVSYLLLKGSKPCSILKIPRFKADTSSVEMEEDKMGQFNQLEIKKRAIDSSIVFIEPWIEGMPPKPYNLSHNQKVLNWLLDFQYRTQKGFWDFNQLETKITALSDFLSEMNIGNGVRSRTRQRMELFLDALSTTRLPKNAEHGDFCTGNMLINDYGQLYVTDWHFYQEEGEPLFDFIFFILHSCTKGARNPNLLQDNFFGRGKYSSISEVLIHEFTQARRLPPGLIRQAVSYTILRLINRATTEEDNEYFNIAMYIDLLESWDRACLSTCR